MAGYDIGVVPDRDCDLDSDLATSADVSKALRGESAASVLSRPYA